MRDPLEQRKPWGNIEIKGRDLIDTMKPPESVYGERPEDKARRLVYEMIKADPFIGGLHSTFALDEVLLVWFTKTLQHWKALVITTLPDHAYYEVTYNGIDGEAYIDHYEKSRNICVVDVIAVPEEL